MIVMKMMSLKKKMENLKKMPKTSKITNLMTLIMMKSTMKIPAALMLKKTMKNPTLGSSIPILTRFYGEEKRLTAKLVSQNF